METGGTSGVQEPDDHDLRAFGQEMSGRQSNDSENKRREKVVVWLVNASADELGRVRSALVEKELLDRVSLTLRDAITRLTGTQSDETGPTEVIAEKKGGRNSNYDFKLAFQTAEGAQEIKVELKRGKSIYVQPQFLSLYVNKPEVLRPGVLNYAEYFYDNFAGELEKITKCGDIDRDGYLRSVIGTTYESEPFRSLKAIAVKKGEGLAYLKELQYRSIDSYIRWLESVSPLPIDFKTLQTKLDEQLEKKFLSWDPEMQNFLWETFSEEQLKLEGSMETGAKPTGQLHTIILPTVTGQRVELLLRWKNNPCVKGPAWQIRLSEPRA